MNLKDLQREIPFKWRIGQVYPTFSGNELSNPQYTKKGMELAKATCLAYIDARDVMDLLDEVCGAENWQDDYKEIHGRLVAGIGIKIHKIKKVEVNEELTLKSSRKEWVWKWDTGTSGNFEEEKSEFSDSFKRAAVKWGVGRFLYSLKTTYVEVAAKREGTKFKWPVPIYPHNHQKIYDLSGYLNDEIARKKKQNKKPR